jgi:hypothetical protein
MVQYISSHPNYQPRSGHKAAVLERLVDARAILELDDGTRMANPAMAMETWDPDTKQWR